MQTVLGSNGTIGRELSKLLPQYTNQIRQVSRNPQKQNANDELVQADLLDYTQTEKAVAGSEIVYLLAGLKYDTQTWQQQWPVVMRNAIDACKKHRAKLVFFDNVYSYGLVNGAMTEETPFNPVSKKGEVRAKIATMLLDEIKSQNLIAMIVHAADFYGPEAKLSMIHSMVTERLASGKKAQWMGNPSKIHTFTYTPDAALTVALLGNNNAAYNQTWHALTNTHKITGAELVRMAYQIKNMPDTGIQTLGKTGVKILGLFIPILKELSEMMYQFDADYIFDSSKAANFLNRKATSYMEGLSETLIKK